MSAVRRLLVGLLAFGAIGVAAAQPASVDPLPPDARGAATNTKIPVTAKGTEVLEAETAGTTTMAAPLSLDEPLDPNKYVCGPGDVFEINFWGQQNFRLRVAADLEGRTFISKVGFVVVTGKTLTEVRAQIKKKVSTNYPGLQFDVTLVNPRSFRVHVVDFVKEPGSYTSSPLERVSSLLARTGGITGSRRRITIRHRDGKQTTADLLMYELTGDTKYNPFLLDGDVVKVPPTATVVTIDGAVRRPGTYELIDTEDLTELLELAGGFTSSVARRLPIRIVRANEQQHEAAHELAFGPGGKAPNEKLQDKDIITVRDAAELQRSILLIGAVVGSDPVDAATTSKRLTFIEGDTVRSLIDRAGGVRAPGDLSRSYILRPDVKTGRPAVVPIDLDALLVRRDFSQDKPVQLGDTIVIPPMRYSVLVEGAVARAGVYNFNPLFGIREYIAHAGGRTRIARDLEEVKIVKPSGATLAYKPDLKLSPGDAILVPERNFSRSEVVQIVIAGAGLILSGVAITLAATR
jgi:protein involved in polysaccharide export with SLBB domain